MKKIFYWRFSRKIEGEFWIFYKRFPWEKNWMEEIFKGISLRNWSWIHTRASLARAVFSFKTFFDCEWRSHLLSPTTSTSWNENERSEWLWSEKVKWSEKWSVFGPLFFLKLIYIIDHIYTFIATRGKCAQQLSYGFNILDKLESCPHENQIPYGDMDFSKKVSKVTDFRW